MSTSARLILGLAMSLIAPATTPGPPAPAVVVAELFTSERCSSCPPADTLMRQLADTQPFEGAEVIALEEHVDYWGRLGWRDPFSSAQFTKRQTDYNDRVFRFAPNWDVGKLRIVGVIQERDSRRILGAGATETSLTPGSD